MAPRNCVKMLERAEIARPASSNASLKKLQEQRLTAFGRIRNRVTTRPSAPARRGGGHVSEGETSVSTPTPLLSLGEYYVYLYIDYQPPLYQNR